MYLKKAATPILVIAIWATGLYAIDLLVNQSPGSRHLDSTDSSKSRSAPPRASSAASVPEQLEQALVEPSVNRESSDKADQPASNVADNTTGESELISIGGHLPVDTEAGQNETVDTPAIVIGPYIDVDQPSSTSTSEESIISIGEPVDLRQLMEGNEEELQNRLTYGPAIEVDAGTVPLPPTKSPKIELGEKLPPPK